MKTAWNFTNVLPWEQALEHGFGMKKKRHQKTRSLVSMPNTVMAGRSKTSRARLFEGLDFFDVVHLKAMKLSSPKDQNIYESTHKWSVTLRYSVMLGFILLRLVQVPGIPHHQG